MNCTVYATIGIVAIMLIAGGLGGLANYLTTEIEDDEKFPAWRRVIVGAIAAIAVPAFLDMISSEIISKDMDVKNYFVFAGFCLLAGFSSKAFLTSMSKGLLDRVKNMEDRQKSLESEVDPILEKETEPDQDQQSGDLVSTLSDEEKEVFKALANPNYSRRYFYGVVTETGLEKLQVNNALKTLKDLDFVRCRTSKGRELFWLTQKGRLSIRKLQSMENYL